VETVANCVGATGKYSGAFVSFLGARWFGSYPEHTLLQMPKLSPTMEQGNLTKWRKKQGEAVAPGEIIAEVETDKATVEFESQDDFHLAKLLVPEGAKEVKVGDVIAVMVDEPDKIAAFADFVLEGKPAAKAAPAAASAPASAAPAAAPAHGAPAAAPAAPAAKPYTGPIGPAVHYLLAQHPEVDVDRVHASGPHGRILKGDVLDAIATGSAKRVEGGAAPAAHGTGAQAHASAAHAAPATPGAAYTDIPNSNIRKAIARRLLVSKTTVPHFYTSQEFTLDHLAEIRAMLNARKNAPKISVNDFVIRAAALALREVPEINVAYTNGVTTPLPTVDVSFAVSLENGLITPIVKNADALNLSKISSTIKGLVQNARDGKLQPDEFEGGTFAVSNLGMFDTYAFEAIINPPQSAILSIGSSFPRVVSVDGTATNLQTATVGIATLCADARAITANDAAKFMRVFGEFMNNPSEML